MAHPLENGFAENEEVTTLAVRRWRPRDSAAPAKALKMRKSMLRQQQQGVPIHSMGHRVYRLLRMTDTWPTLNGDRGAVKDKLALAKLVSDAQRRDADSLPEHTSTEWYSTGGDTPDTLPDSTGVMDIRSAVQREYKACMNYRRDNSAKWIDTAENLRDESEATYPRIYYS